MWLFKKKRKKEKEKKTKMTPTLVTTSNKDGEDLTLYERNIFVEQVKCPDCGGALYNGPRGPGAQNILCGNKDECGVRFSLMNIFGQSLVTRLDDKRYYNE